MLQLYKRSLVSILFLMPLMLVHSSALALKCQSLFKPNPSVARLSKPMKKFVDVFGTDKPVIGMIHLAGGSEKEIVTRALQELALFQKQGVHAAIIENYHTYDIKHVELVLAASQGKFPGVKIGVNILPNEYAIAFALARAYGATFIQLDYVSGKYGNRFKSAELDVADYTAYRNEYSEILVLGGVHPKYYTPVPGSDLAQDILDATKRADAVVVTGAGTGKETPLDKILKFRDILGPNFPLVIGAGMTAENAFVQLPISQGVIVGSYFKNGYTQMPLDPQRVKEFMSVYSATTQPPKQDQ